MATLAALQTSINDPNTIKRQVAERVELLSPKSTPFLTSISGGGDGKPKLNNLSKSVYSVTGTMVEWFTDELRKLQFKLSANVTNIQTTITVTPANDAGHLVKDLIIRVPSTGERMLVTVAGDLTTGTATVTRGFAGTTPTAITAGTTYDIVVESRSLYQTANFANDTYIQKTSYFNVWQGFYETYSATWEEQSMDRYAMLGKNSLEDSRKKALMEFVRKIEQAGITAMRNPITASFSGISPTNPPTMGGLMNYLPATNVTNAGGAAFSASLINSPLVSMFANGGDDNTPNTILVPPGTKVKMSQTWGQGYVQVNRDETTTTGGYALDRIRTDFGEIDIVVSPYLVGNEAYLYKSDSIGIGALPGREVAEYQLPSSGPADYFALYGVYSMTFMRPSALWRIFNYV